MPLCCLQKSKRLEVRDIDFEEEKASTAPRLLTPNIRTLGSLNNASVNVESALGPPRITERAAPGG
jgi:hypothetical protein